MQSNTWLGISKDDERESLVLVRSPYKNNVKKKIAALADGYGALNWTIWKLPDEDARFLTEKFELNILYQTNHAEIS